jgi:manganese/zinc/iron transport system permease protein
MEEIRKMIHKGEREDIKALIKAFVNLRVLRVLRGSVFLGAIGWALTLAAPLVSVSEAAGLADHSFQWPTWDALFRVLTLQEYNTRVVIIGSSLLGLAAGLIGTFLLLRKRALLSDALSHATLPGIALAFILMTIFLGDGKHLLGLIGGAAIFSVLGTASVIVIQKHSRIKDDAALGIVLSVYFGLGIALMGLATRMESGNAAGLSSFIYGKTASMLYFDAVLIGAAALACALSCILFFKEFSLICFDSDYASTQGWPVGRLDFFMMTLVVGVTVIGLQAVGLILLVALLIIPPSAARFWTFNLRYMVGLSGIFGALSGLVGSGISALMANLPAGAVIVLAASSIFLFSLAFGTARGLIRLGLERTAIRRKIIRENILRELYEWFEVRIVGIDPVKMEFHPEKGPAFRNLLSMRSWSPRLLHRSLKKLQKAGLLSVTVSAGTYGFTTAGKKAAEDVVRKHRLWEAYLMAHADIAPGQVDWGADEIEHVLDKQMIENLERMLPGLRPKRLPPSPHRLGI